MFSSKTDQLQGHGTLNAIYDSVGKACKRRGWDGVDILIIGGDFQVGALLRFLSQDSLLFLSCDLWLSGFLTHPLTGGSQC